MDAAGSCEADVVLSRKQPGIAIPASVFPTGSAFPGPGVAVFLDEVRRIADDDDGARLFVLGHAEDPADQALMDRRGKAVAALLTHDLDLFESVAAEETWDLLHDEVMLRFIGNDPGPIDGAASSRTEVAVKAFQTEYNLDVFHDGVSDAGIARRHGDLVVTGELDEPTRLALRDAYVSCFVAYVDPARFDAPRFAGRADLAPGEVPHGATVLVHGRQRRFYRVETPPAALPPFVPAPFFDLVWRKEAEPLAAQLSAITWLPDGPVTFTVYRCDAEGPPPAPTDSSRGQARPTPGTVLGTVEGQIKGGVAFASWTPPEGYDPFAPHCWVIPVEIDLDADYPVDEDGDPAPGSPFSPEALSATVWQPPAFAVEANARWALSAPPGRRLDRLTVSAPEGVGSFAVTVHGELVRVPAGERLASRTPVITVGLGRSSWA